MSSPLIKQVPFPILAFGNHNRCLELARGEWVKFLHGDDELTRLAATINDSLAKREQSQEEQFRTLNAELTRVNNELQEKKNSSNSLISYPEQILLKQRILL